MRAHLMGKWLPLHLPGLKIWVEADRGVTLDVDSKCSQITAGPDSSLVATQSDPTKRMLWQANQINGRPALVASGGQGLSIDSITLSSSFTAFCLFSATSAGIVYEHSINASSNDGEYLYPSNNNASQVRRLANQNGINYNAGWGTDGNWKLVRQRCVGTLASHKLYVNGGLLSTAYASGSTDVAISDAAQPLFLGSRNNSSAFITGKYAFLIIYCPALTTVQESYFEVMYGRYKYGLTIAT